MSIKKLPSEVNILLCASAKINTFKKAIEELVYNSLDAGASSIAIRVNIQESTIQVIDNGCGIRHFDFNALGRKHMTSNYVDVSTLKSAPNKYGLRGEALANIVAVSQVAKITSRCEETEETWVKTFLNGRERKIAITVVRPSKGTTVEIKGFLYNLSIQKMAINPLNELQNIKTFLEQLSLVYSNISLSLRDDSKNEIVFQIHKKRDIYQTLHNLFNIERNNVQELKVEKNEYKVTGFIGKNDGVGKHWIYLNGKFVGFSSKLYKIVNNCISKSVSNQNKQKVKSKVMNNDEENHLFTNKIPFYFIFLSCPYIDYDINHTPKHSLLEFKDWDKIKILLEKLTKFYLDGVNLKPLKKNVLNTVKENNTRDQVKLIMNKILGNKSDKPCISKMQNGVKGKLIKRKNKRKPPSIDFSKVICSPTQNQSPKLNTPPIRFMTPNNVNDDSDSSTRNIQSKNPKEQSYNGDIFKKNKKIKTGNEIDNKHTHEHARSKNLGKIIKNKKGKNFNNCSGVLRQKHFKKYVIDKKIDKHNKTSMKNKTNKTKIKKNPILRKFELATESVKQRCDKVAQEAEKVLNKFSQLKRQVFVNGTVEYSSVTKDNRNVAVCKKVNEIIIHDYYPKNFADSVDYRIWKKPENNYYKTTYDLVQTVLDNQDKSNFDQVVENDHFKIPDKSVHSPMYIESEPVYIKPFELNDEYDRSPVNINSSPDILRPHCDIDISNIPKLTYNSHSYGKYNDTLNGYSSHTRQKTKQCRFIAKHSRDNFIVNEKRSKTSHKSQFKPHSRLGNKVLDKNIMLSKMHHCFMNSSRRNIETSSYTIEFSGNGDNFNHRKKEHTINQLEKDITNNIVYNFHDNPTYTVRHKNSNITSNFNTYEMKEAISNDPESNIEYSETICVNTSTANVDKVYDAQYTSYLLHNSATNTVKFKSVTSLPSINQNIIQEKEFNNIIFISNSQEANKEECGNLGRPGSNNNTVPNIEPLDVCETILQNSSSLGKEFEYSFNVNKLNDSLFNLESNKDGNQDNNDEPVQNNNKYVSRHFNIESHTIGIRMDLDKNNEELTHTLINKDIEASQDNLNKAFVNPNEVNTNCFANVPAVMFHFNIKDRLRFLPKGMSQIFENCNTKTACDYNLDEDYYNNTIYDNYANDVQIHSEIYEPGIQNVKELVTKNIDKFNIKIVQDDASLKFHGQYLKDAMVLGQVDGKFIAAIIDGNCSRSGQMLKFLVLFDQHAVHERIRLENNLADYIPENQWKSISIDEIVLTLSKDDIIFLHNYKDKFELFGLQWSITNTNEIIVTAIPEAILSKHPRQVEKLTIAVKKLIIEEINIIKMQKGCISLYPKSIMDLVFSEACRYAIKFGDKLSKTDCEELIRNLSDCKTPFQCAHGRPVMAVLMNYRSDVAEYKINPEKLRISKQNMIAT